MARHVLAFVVFCLFVLTNVSEGTMHNYCYYYGEATRTPATCDSRISEGSNCFSDRDVSTSQYCSRSDVRNANCEYSYCCSIKESYDDALASQAHFGGKCVAETIPSA
ncbi:hypothetical protein BC943DRAFT_321350 [Umbelopsis sp. AD052]|nr:hypothetical protein BC943DRAFT_321350 [Umbelopsis sp. AD052]